MLKTEAYAEIPSYKLKERSDAHQFFVRTHSSTHQAGALPSCPGVAVVYEASKRLSDAPEGTFIIDAYTLHHDGDTLAPQLVYRGSGNEIGRQVMRLGATYASAVVYEAEFPRFVREKMAVLKILRSAHTLSYGGFVYCPGVGAAFGSGNYWLHVTWEDLLMD